MTPEEAEYAETSGDSERALALWKALGQRDRSPLFLCRAGSIAEDLRYWQRAEDLYQEALKLDAHFAIALESMGQLWSGRDDKPRDECLQEAKAYFLRALNEERNERVLTCLGSVYECLDQSGDARSMFEEALRICPDYEEAMFNLAENIGSNDPDTAIEWLNRAIGIDPNYSAAHRELGIHFVRKRNLPGAEYHLRRALEINPADYWANMQLANLCGLQGRNDEAQQLYRFATTLHPDIKAGLEIFSRFLDSIGQSDEAARVRKSDHI